MSCCWWTCFCLRSEISLHRDSFSLNNNTSIIYYWRKGQQYQHCPWVFLQLLFLAQTMKQKWDVLWGDKTLEKNLSYWWWHQSVIIAHSLTHTHTHTSAILCVRLMQHKQSVNNAASISCAIAELPSNSRVTTVGSTEHKWQQTPGFLPYSDISRDKPCRSYAHLLSVARLESMFSCLLWTLWTLAKILVRSSCRILLSSGRELET